MKITDWLFTRLYKNKAGGGSVKSPPEGKWSRLVLNDRPRISGGVIFSVLLHFLVISLYWGLADMSVPESEPIREINFIDLTEEPPPPPVREAPAPREPLKMAGNEAASETPSEAAEQPALNDARFTGNDRIFLDTPRKQAPINLEKVKSVGGDLAQPGDMIKISAAKGIQQNDRIARPAPIDLKRDSNIRLTSNTPGSGGIAMAATKNPEIKLSGSPSRHTTGSGTGIRLDSGTGQPAPKPETVTRKTTRTFITGPLANRRILKKTIPPFPRWAKKQGVGATISLRFTVMEDGSLRENILVERTSGSREWDQLVIEALKSWKFASLEKKDTRLDQTGVITFQFVI